MRRKLQNIKELERDKTIQANNINPLFNLGSKEIKIPLSFNQFSLIPIKTIIEGSSNS